MKYRPVICLLGFALSFFLPFGLEATGGKRPGARKTASGSRPPSKAQSGSRRRAESRRHGRGSPVVRRPAPRPTATGTSRTRLQGALKTAGREPAKGVRFGESRTLTYDRNLPASDVGRRAAEASRSRARGQSNTRDARKNVVSVGSRSSHRVGDSRRAKRARRRGSEPSAVYTPGTPASPSSNIRDRVTVNPDGTLTGRTSTLGRGPTPAPDNAARFTRELADRAGLIGRWRARRAQHRAETGGVRQPGSSNPRPAAGKGR